MSDITLSLSSEGFLRLRIPSVVDETQTSSIDIAPSPEGVKAIIKILRARQREAKALIGTDAHPVRSQVEAWLAADRAQRAAERREAATKQLSALDVTLAALDLDLDL